MTRGSDRVAALTPEEFRKHFPVLEHTVHLASCSLAPRSTVLDEAMERMLTTMADDPTPWDMWWDEVEQSRRRFAALIGADAAQVAVVPSATTAAFQTASTLRWDRRPEIVATDAEYASVAQVWAAQRPRGARVTTVPEAGEVAEAIDEHTNLVSMPLVSYHTGAVMPVAEAVARARQVGARTFVDAYQAAGVQPIDVDALGCDYLTSGTMKYLLGLPGLAYLYVRPGLADELDPQLTGFLAARTRWRSIRRRWTSRPTPAGSR